MKKAFLAVLTALLMLGFTSMGFAADGATTELQEEANTTSSEVSKPKAVKKYKHRKKASRKNSKKRTKKNNKKKVKEAYKKQSHGRE